MFNIGTGEIALIAVVALLVLGPKRLPELARGIGKFMREFRRQTDEVRGVVEREFYKMDQEVSADLPASPPLMVQPAPDAVALGAGDAHDPHLAQLPAVTEQVISQLDKGTAPSEPVTPAPTETTGASTPPPADEPQKS